MTSTFPSDGQVPLPATRETVEEVVIPLVAEVLTVGKRTVDTGRVRVHTVVDEEAVVLQGTNVRSTVGVERVPVGRVVEIAPETREEGDVLIIPVVEEQVFTQTRLVLVEEVRITRTRTEVPVELPATRRVMRAVVERDDAPNKTQ